MTQNRSFYDSVEVIIVSALTPFTEPDDVLGSIRQMTDRIHLGLHRLLPETRKYFESHNLPVDKALHAMLTRFELKHHLLAHQIAATNEEDTEDLAFSVRGVANCGLVISGPGCVLRILKSHNAELPLSASRERSEFYQGNLFAFEANDPYPDRPIPPLNLVGAWETNPDHGLGSFSIVCPWGEVGNRVQNKWWRTLLLPTALPPASEEMMPPEPSLDEITPKDHPASHTKRDEESAAEDAQDDNAD
jgi:hypothetical protein